ncbi:MAG: PPOX class F420-dependent oxidoreductase [Actinomycetota bacterium]|nr:PPOX class F420-dependent oxidoreductase [Actinomycetota bacterium]
MPYNRMSPEQTQAFLASSPPHTGKLATTRADRSPHVAPVWFDLDDDGSIVFTTGARTVKGRNLQRDSRAALCVDDERPPFSFVAVEGRVQLYDDPAELRRWATRIGARYMGAGGAEAYGRRNAVPGELVARLVPERWSSARGVAD